MPKDLSIKKVLLLGSGPIVIGQACEFDYSGTQALTALKEEGLEVVLLNSNPATIMTDPELSDRVYIEPLNWETAEKIIKKEKPDSILSTMGGQTALNLTLELHKKGILEKYNIRILGANPESILNAEDRARFKEIMTQIGVETAQSTLVRSLEEGKKVLREIGLPLILRPSFTLGGEGGGTAHTEEDFFNLLEKGLFYSPTKEVLVEESLLGWKEFELEVVRDKANNVIIICSIENFDPMGVHTGDSVTVAPAQTLTDVEFQNLRNQSISIIRAIGVETGGSNIQFAIHPKTGRIICIEMNPRVSRSSALASKATGFPIARVATKLAIGYTLNELTNDITQTTPCSFEPTLDYVVTKIPRFDFEKFSPSPRILTTQMKSVGEVMAIGRTFEESFFKALSGLEITKHWAIPLKESLEIPDWSKIELAHPLRPFAIVQALIKKASPQEISDRSQIDIWFIERLAHFLENIPKKDDPITEDSLRYFKAIGFTDFSLSLLLGVPEEKIRAARKDFKITASFHAVDTCAGEFKAKTPYYYSSYSGQNELEPQSRSKVMIIGGGPNRIGQGIEFDYCCVHAAKALKKLGIETLMVNCNPETVSTDFDISDRLFFEPLTVENILNIAEIEKPLGVIIQFGGQTPLRLSRLLEKAGLKILGTSSKSVDIAEDREKCSAILNELKPLGLKQPPSATATDRMDALEKAKKIGFPVLVRPSYVLGGRGMKIVHDEDEFLQWIDEAIDVSESHPVLLDHFLHRAIEVDVDAICDGKETVIGGIMEHIEEAGIHSGDSACSLPPFTLTPAITDRLRTFTKEIAKKLEVKGLLNIQYAVKGDDVYILEINPRASRTVPFISKATGIPLAKIAVEVIMGKTLHDLDIRQDLDFNLNTYNVKVPVFPFHKFPQADILLGPEMKSTGEVMGRDTSFASAYAKAMTAAGMAPPTSGTVFLSIRDQDKAEILPIAQKLKAIGFNLCATKGTADFLNRYDLDVQWVYKVKEGSPHCVDAIRENKFSFIINTTTDVNAIKDSFSLRRAAIEKKIPYATVLPSARAMIQAIEQKMLHAIDITHL